MTKKIDSTTIPLNASYPSSWGSKINRKLKEKGIDIQDVISIVVSRGALIIFYQTEDEDVGGEDSEFN